MRIERIQVLMAFIGLGLGACPFAQISNKFGLPVPGLPAPGFIVSRGPEFYGTEQRPLDNGRIFDYIDGGGVVYINHGFQAVVHIVFEDKNKNSITVDIFDMGNTKNALSAYADELICPSGYETIPIGAGAKSYHFEPDYFIDFAKGRYLVYCHVNNDALSRLLVAYARTISEEVL
jgi:Family of unknown function (DUF6599)